MRLTQEEVDKEKIEYDKWLNSFKSDITKTAFGIWLAAVRNTKERDG